ncbi:hypothetical protein RIF29_08956 [Crotalaria pallida]|uniref:Uncharacterized protein n=1 Tax=Crotalaria pallida TaxID=3830 RepID=A0AAN9FRE3_CROPI
MNWVPPVYPWVGVNCDGACNVDPQVVVCRGLIMIALYDIHWAFSRNLTATIVLNFGCCCDCIMLVTIANNWWKMLCDTLSLRNWI